MEDENKVKDINISEDKEPEVQVKEKEVKNELVVDFENLKKEFSNLKAKINGLEKNNDYLKNENKDLHRKIIKEEIEPSAPEKPSEPFNEFDPSTWITNQK